VDLRRPSRRLNTRLYSVSMIAEIKKETVRIFARGYERACSPSVDMRIMHSESRGQFWLSTSLFQLFFYHSRPQSHDPSYLRQGSRALAGPDFLSMCRVFVSYSQPIRFAGFDGKSVNRGLPVLDKARALDPCRRSEGSWL